MRETKQMEFNKQSLPDYKERLFDKQSQVALRVTYLLKQKGWTRKRLAEKMGVKEASLSRMLASVGSSNLTLETISRMELALDDILLLTPEEAEYQMIQDPERAEE